MFALPWLISFSHFPDLLRIGQSRERVEEGRHGCGAKRWKAERIVDETIHFRVVPAKPVEPRARRRNGQSL
jgi:hypothetical protein